MLASSVPRKVRDPVSVSMVWQGNTRALEWIYFLLYPFLTLGAVAKAMISGDGPMKKEMSSPLLGARTGLLSCKHSCLKEYRAFPCPV